MFSILSQFFLQAKHDMHSHVYLVLVLLLLLLILYDIILYFLLL